ncbi:MAG: radical SAM protein [Planctomycetia bacterium]|nr:radical SAM protein [Planctomycetia bacterium]
MISLDDILFWLREKDADKLQELWQLADNVRQNNVGHFVHLRGLIELSNYCRRNCLYCGIRASHQNISRYRLSMKEALECAKLAHEFEYGTVVIQSGEDFLLDEGFIAELIQEIKRRFSLAITLSLGERNESEWVRWKEAGADRYLLRFETSNQQLFEAIHPRAADSIYPNRLKLLRTLREFGYEIGSGVMIGIPGQSVSDLANDIELFRELELDMIGCGPYLAHPETPLGRLSIQNGFWVSNDFSSPLNLTQNPDLSKNQSKEMQSKINSFRFPCSSEQVESSNEMAFKVIALARLVCPTANIPSTTAIATIDGKQGRINGLSRGANVIMPNLTPIEYRNLYEIYPNKAAVYETAQQTHQMAIEQIHSIGREAGKGPGTSIHFERQSRFSK